ncbi:MAG: aspartyl-tRNA(Asn)/glutamyl-tRNA(Gln) amidotransferase subunit C [Cyclobacteriaceae bacterium]|jgi:aspartyl-tRNA(Asn)/glutamyl-tRNA(Gln) amidotransferase subunit C
MNIDQQTLEKIAHLARLDISALDQESLKKDIAEVLTWVEQLGELDTEGVEPLINMSFEINSFRNDIPSNPISHEEALKNAPKRDADYFLVPKVLK